MHGTDILEKKIHKWPISKRKEFKLSNYLRNANLSLSDVFLHTSCYSYYQEGKEMMSARVIVERRAHSYLFGHNANQNSTEMHTKIAQIDSK